MEHRQKERYRDLLNRLIVLSIPTMVEEILSTLMQYVDTAMVGHLGEQATAAVNVTTSIGWLVGSVSYSFGAAILALMSQAYGASDRKRGRRLAGQAMFLTVFFGILLGAASIILSPYIPVWMGAEKAVQAQASLYFTIISIPMVFRVSSAILGSTVRATQNTRTPMLISVLSNLLNVVLNYLLIYAAGLGVTGAAIATAVSFSVGGFLTMVLFLRTGFFFPERESGPQEGKDRSPASGRSLLSLLRPDYRSLKEICTIGIPVMGTSVVSTMGHVVFTGMVSGMGTTIFAAHSIAVTAEEIFYIPGYGLRTATSALVGAAIGEKNERKFSIYCRLSVALTVGMMLLSGVVLFFIARPLMSLFTPSAAVVDLGSEMLRLVAFSEPFFGLLVVMQGILYGMGRTKYAFFTEAVSMWGIRILFSFLVVHVWHLGLREVWYCMIACNVSKAILLTLPFLIKRKRVMV